jgi:lysophospholipase L1-like esterase
VTRLLACLLAACLLAGCTSSGDEPPSPLSSEEPSGDLSALSPPEVGRYVALGDSFSAGPLIATTDLAGGCVRSDHNYPSLVAADLEVDDFVDVTCSGATPRDLTRVSHPFPESTIPPQLRAVTPGTDLVTLGIGGNDLDLFATLVRTCTRLRGSDPQGDPCTRRFAEDGPDLRSATRTISNRVAGALREIRARAPQARVLLVGYLRLVPDRGTCPALPLAAGDYPQGRRISRALNQALVDAADRTDVEFVDAYELSRGHDICSADPWVNGRVSQREKALSYHPFESGMRAVADEVVDVLTSG